MTSSTKRTPTVLITNDDGPPSPESPFVYGLVQALRQGLQWSDVRVVLPSGQRSWVGKAYLIKDTIKGSYYTPDEGKDGRDGQTSTEYRGTGDEWVLLDGTPATCANIALNNLFVGEIDLVVSGPNYGRNTSSAFALSSGTVGAAMAASMSGVPSIALSYGLFQEPVAEEIIKQAHESAIEIIRELWERGFKGEDAPNCYNVNIPLLPSLAEKKPVVRWTTLAERKYGRLFAPVTEPRSPKQEQAKQAGPSAVHTGDEPGPKDSKDHRVKLGDKLAFRFAPDLERCLIEGTDIHAITAGEISVTPLKAAFAGAPVPKEIGADGKGAWKL